MPIPNENDSHFGAGAPVRKRSAITMVLPAPLYQIERGLSSLFLRFGEISPGRAGLCNHRRVPAEAPKCKVENQRKWWAAPIIADLHGVCQVLFTISLN